MGIPFFYWLSLANHQLSLGCCAVVHAGRVLFFLRLSRRSEGWLRISDRMALHSAHLWLLMLLAVALWDSCVGYYSHSLKYFYTSVSEPSQGLPQFVVQGYVDGQVFLHYDSHTRRMQPRVSWIEKYVGKEEPEYWERETQISRGHEEQFRENLEIARNRYNQSEGLHTLQWLYGCELWRDGSKGGFLQYGYDGRTFIAFDKETLTWVAADPQAQITQRKWDGIPGVNERQKAYLEETCIAWLEKYLSYGNETLLRTEPPAVTVRGKTDVEDGMETHICRLDGFYPREIDASWTRDGEIWLEETFHGSLAPNADGTYHYWLSARINPNERGRYRCHVEHDGLQEPLDLALEGASSHSLKYFSTAVSEPSQGQPQFVTVGYVDSQAFVHYDSNSQRMQPSVSWIEKVGKEDPQFWDRQTQGLRDTEEMFRENLENLRSRHNQSEGLHTWQSIYGCELRRDGSKGGFLQYAYEGRTFITFDKETLTWVAPDPLAQITQRKWDGIPGYNQRWKAYLEEECNEWLEKYLSYGNETLLRTEPPEVTVRGRIEVTVRGKRDVENRMETHVCRLDGFYPREIDAFWTRDGEVLEEDTSRGSVAPNADGTYHYWLSARIDPNERGHYQCHVEHDGLQEPLDLALEGSNQAA